MTTNHRFRSGHRVAVAAVLAAVCAHGEQRADFMVLGRPLDYSVVNRFEQPLDVAEKKLFLPNVPLRLGKKSVTLGDGMTQAMEVGLWGATYYLRKEDDGSLTTGGAGEGYRKTFSACLVLGDTVRITQGGVVPFHERYGDGGERIVLEVGDQLARVFSQGGSCCALLLGARARYGWCPLSPKAWSVVREQDEAPEAVLAPGVRDRIAGRFAAANESYAALFAHFNTQAKSDRSAPAWELEQSEKQVRATLRAPAATARQLQGSTEVLMHDVRSLLLGKPFVVEYAEGVVTVRPE